MNNSDFIKILKSSTFWIALGSIATFSMAFLTYRLLRYYKKTDKERTLRQIVEKIIRPLIGDLEKIIDRLSRLSVSRSGLLVSMEEVWQWSEIKKGNSFLVYSLSKAIKEKIDSFHETLEKFIHLHNQRKYPIDEIVSEEIRNRLLEEVKKIIGRDSLISGSKGTYYQLTIGGKRRQIFFHELIFRAQSLDEYIEEMKTDPTIPNADIEDEKFIVDEVTINGVDKETFIEIASTILRKIKEDLRLQEFVESCRKVHNEAKILRQDLSDFSSELIK